MAQFHRKKDNCTHKTITTELVAISGDCALLLTDGTDLIGFYRKSIVSDFDFTLVPENYKKFQVTNIKNINAGEGKLNKIEYGANCKKCNEYNEYVEKNNNFTCYRCRS